MKGISALTLKTVLCVSILVTVSGAEAWSYEERNYITAEYEAALSQAGGESLVRPGGDWFPYPEYSDRSGWEDLFGQDRERIIKEGEKLLGFNWQLIPATAYLEYERSGNRKIMEEPMEANRVALNRLILAELAEGEGRFTDQIINGLWMSCQMTSWVLSAHNPRQSSRRSLPDPREYIIDLVSGGYGATVAIAWHFFRDQIEAADPSVNYCIRQAVKERILDPYLDESVRQSNWWIAEDWKPGQIINNWNPWCNSNVLLCYLLMEEDQARLDAAVRLSVESVDRFVNFVKSDGACEEGPSYWGHAAGKLYDYLALLYDATCGKVSLFDNEQVRLMGEYISRSYIGDSWVVNFADATASMSPDAYLIYRYGRSAGSREMMDFALYLMYSPADGCFRAPAVPTGNDTYRSLETARVLEEMGAKLEKLNSELASVPAETVLAGLRSDVPSAVWYPETEFCYLRDGAGSFFAAKGGFNNESHNHNDVGTFILYADGSPLFVDAGVGTYTKKTFGPDRYSIWSMQSNWHSLPVINGVPQSFGAGFRSSDVSCSLENREFSLDISGAYPDSAECGMWKREYSLSDGKLVIRDNFRLSQRNEADVENFLVHGNVSLPGETYVHDGVRKVVPQGRVVVSGDGAVAEISYPRSLEPSAEARQLDDPRLTGVWGNVLHRISFTSDRNAPVSGQYRFVIRILK